MKRRELKSIYDLLPNAEKTAWARNSNYTSYQGLYRYLRDNGEEEAYRRVVDGLKITVGQNRFNTLITQASQSNLNQTVNTSSPIASQLMDDLERIKMTVIANISSFNSMDELRDLELTFETVGALIRNQRERVELIDTLNN